MVVYHFHKRSPVIVLGYFRSSFFFPANASSVTTAVDATSITATAATIAKVMYDFILSLKTRIKTISAAKVEATNIILEILSIVNIYKKPRSYIFESHFYCYDYMCDKPW